MKKQILLVLLAAAVLAGCTSKEQDMKIRLFWMGQLGNYSMKNSQKNMEKLMKLSTGNFGKKNEWENFDFKDLEGLEGLENWENFEDFDSTTNTLPASAPANATTAAARKEAPKPQIMEVTMDTDALPGIAPYEERVRMKRAWDAVQLANQKMLADIEKTFGEGVKNRAFYYTTDNEKTLKTIASSSSDFNSYFALQQHLLADQEQKINNLLKKNTKNIRKIKK